jgi:hypothetical protein
MAKHASSARLAAVAMNSLAGPQLVCSFPLRLQPEPDFDKAADGLRARHGVTDAPRFDCGYDLRWNAGGN